MLMVAYLGYTATIVAEWVGCTAVMVIAEWVGYTADFVVVVVVMPIAE